jgi:hypothetical protein
VDHPEVFMQITEARLWAGENANECVICDDFGDLLM